MIFAFQVLPIVIFIASLFAILYQLGVMQVVVRAMAVVMQQVMGASGAESTSVAASIFMGQTEAPLTIRPFLAGLTQSELFTIMTSGMAHVSGAVMAAYVKIAHVEIKHLLTAVIMTAPATIMLAKIMIPETETARDRGQRQGGSGEAGRQHDRCGGARRGRRAATRAEYRRHADRVPRADRDGERASGLAHTACRDSAGFPRRCKAIFGDDLRAGRLADGRRLERLRDCRQSARHAPGAERVCRVSAAGADEGSTRSALVRDRDLCAVRICEFSSIAIQIGGIGALAPTRKSDLARLGLRAVAAGIDGKLHVGLHRRHVAVSTCCRSVICVCFSRLRAICRQMPTAPSIGVVLGSGLGGFADELDERDRNSLCGDSRMAAIDGDRTCGQAGVRHSSAV